MHMLTLAIFLTHLMRSCDAAQLLLHGQCHSGGLTVGCSGLGCGEGVLSSVQAAQLTDVSCVCPGS